MNEKIEKFLNEHLVLLAQEQLSQTRDWFLGLDISKDDTDPEVAAWLDAHTGHTLDLEEEPYYAWGMCNDPTSVGILAMMGATSFPIIISELEVPDVQKIQSNVS